MPQNSTTGIKTLISEANKAAPKKSVNEVKHLYQNKDYIFIDLRDIQKLKKGGKTPRSFSCPRGMLEFWIGPENPYHKEIFNQNKPYMLYCASTWTSELSVRTAIEMGLKPVVHLAGGFTALEKAEMPIEKLT